MARFYTAARRFPQLIGRTPDGTKLPFGPYTVVQIGVAGVTAIVLWNTTAVWARFGLIANVVVAVGLVFAAVWSAGRLPPGLRNPLVIVGGWMRAAERSLGSGRPVAVVRLRKPRIARGQVTMFTDADARVSDAQPTPTPDAAATAAAADAADAADDAAVDLVDAAAIPAVSGRSPEPSLPPLTGVQRLLAQSTPR